MKYKIFYPAENYIMLEFGNKISEEINKYVIALATDISHEAIYEVVPAYSSLLIEFDNTKKSAKAICDYIKRLKPDISQEGGRNFILPVLYGGEYGPDLRHVASINNLTEEEVINIHSSISYRVYMLGFMPGFCYLGGMDHKIACERKKEPRLKIPRGSVGIAGHQTGVYPDASPGGWQIIGRTEFELYRPKSKEMFPIKAGDTISFKSLKKGDTL
ncbi:MAG: 5-oxoprolinase subunit PxpB [Clostridiales bacterium]|nr:5-oxoprolinase subunit PxpB [Clostridiales bacterium]